MKRIFSIVLILILIISLPCTVSAANRKVVDESGLLSASEILELNKIAQSLADNYEIDAVIVIVNTLNDKSVQAYADDYFDYNGYGVGSDDSGVLLLVAMKERQWYVSTHAEGTEAVTYNEIGILDEEMADYLSSGDFYDAFATYLNLLESEFEHYRTYENGFTFEGLWSRLLTGLFIGAIIAGIALWCMRSKMNTAKQQSDAASYMVSSSYNLYRCQDIFLYSKTTKTPKAQNNSSGGSHRSSSGRSHGGRGGRF